MVKVEKTNVFGWESCIRGMRNPMNSWAKSDSKWYYDENGEWKDKFVVGPNDLQLMKNLSKAGNDHAKFLRYIHVSVDITAPFYWWKEFDTYKVGTVANSCSTMHKIHANEFTLDDFSHEHLDDEGIEMLNKKIEYLNRNREKFIETKDKQYWWNMIQSLESSYNQKRTIDFNYQVLKSMYFARCHHKLNEWHDLCAWCETLPYFKEICIEVGDNNE